MFLHALMLCFSVFTGMFVFSYGDATSDAPSLKARQMMNEFVETFNRHDPAALGEFWTNDALYSNPLKGISVEGKEALVEEFKKWFEVGKAAKIEVKLVDVKVGQNGNLEEKGVFRVTLKDNAPPIENAFRAILLEQNGKLLFDEFYQVKLDKTLKENEHLKELEWLIGDWVDSDSDISIQTKASWDENKNFITQRFNVEIFDQKLLEGQQIIAWDSAIQKIRSWVFDSEGGFGEGKWNKKGDNWYVNVAYTLPDGRKGSAVHVYSKVDNNSYKWFTEGRDIDGEILPNLPPVTVIRKSGKEAQ